MIRKYKGYFARNEDGSLWFHQEKPHKKGNIWVNKKKSILVCGDYFSDITKDNNEPTKVEISIDYTL